MGSCHIAHDCKIGDNNIFANNTLLAGHVIIEVSLWTSETVSFHVIVYATILSKWHNAAANAGPYAYCRSHSCSPVLPYWLFCFHWWGFCGMFGVFLSDVHSVQLTLNWCWFMASQVDTKISHLILLVAPQGFTRCPKVLDGSWRKSRTPWSESGRTSKTWIYSVRGCSISLAL